MRPFFIPFLFAASFAWGQTTPVDFARDVQPVLAAKCMSCHSGDTPQAGLKIHTRDDLLKGGRSGPAVIAGDGNGSLLIAKMQGRKGLRMPPSGPAVESEVIDRIRIWIDQGAQFKGATFVSERIASIDPRTPAIPSGAKPNPIDRFINVYFAAHNLEPRPTVSDAVFARRAWLDVTGLLPPPEQLRAFEADTRPDKRARLIDRLLANRLDYGEHWITFWNDLLRNDEGVVYYGERKSITDWLRRALEDNLPYDEMVRELLNPADKIGPEGFLTGVTWRGVVSASQTPPMQAAQNAAQVFLGMNLKCAACHDSFVNRWKLRDTYGLASMFSEKPLELVRCDVKLGRTAEPRFPLSAFDLKFDDSLLSRRRAAGEWFTDRRNGRFARTIVNRYWARLLGHGIVEPLDDMDAEPWSQDLLDWLASDFVEHGYDLQHLLRQIMTSDAYGMKPALEDKKAEKYIFRGPVLRRVTAEQFSDALSAVTGDWRVNSPRNEAYAAFTREWRLKSDPLSRALGRPIRDQVYTDRNSDSTTLQALELTNGPLLRARIEHGARSLLGRLEPAPANVWDSRMIRRGGVPVEADISGAKELWLLIEDVDSYDRARVRAGWTDAELIGPSGTVKLTDFTGSAASAATEIRVNKQPVRVIGGAIPSSMSWNIAGKGFTQFRAKAMIDDAGQQSDINAALRFFVFTQKPNPERLIRVQGEPISTVARTHWTTSELTSRLYVHLLARSPEPKERETAEAILGRGEPKETGLEDLLWALLMSPEFQYIH